MNLNVEHLECTIGRQDILNDVSLAVESGTLVSIAGPNGAGKSTLLKCVGQLLGYRGRVLLDGIPASEIPSSRRSAAIGYVPQSFSSVFPFTVFDFVLLGRRSHLGWKPRKKDLVEVSAVLALLKINSLGMRPVNRLSGGEKQLVLIARALVRRPGVLLLDEPTSSLDIRHQLEILQLIRRLAERFDMAVVMAIHDLNLAMSFSHRIVLIGQGRVRQQGPPEQVVTRENIRQVYGVECYIPENTRIPFMIPLLPGDRRLKDKEPGDPADRSG